MKIKCINDYGWKYLTIGKIYDVISINEWGNYYIINDNNKRDCYFKEQFRSLSEMRNETIDKLLK